MTGPFVSPFTVPDDDVAAAEVAAAQLREYSKWEAATKITHGNATAYLEGHPIPIDNCERLGYAKAGLARLSNGWIDRNPEDPDVQRFMVFAEKYPDHPDVRRYAAHLEARKAAEDEAAKAVPNPFADDAEVEPAADAAAQPVSGAAGVTAADTEAPDRQPAAKAEAARKPATKGREATNTGSEG